MRKNLVRFLVVAGLALCPIMVSAAEFGIIDAAQIFNKYNETQKTKTMLENKKATLQKQLEEKKDEVQKLDAKYKELAKDLQKKRDAKKDKEIPAIEKQMGDVRKQLIAKESDLQNFYKTSQEQLYALEEKEMGALSKNLDSKVDAIIEKISKSNKLKAVFEKRSIYWKDKTAFKDITDEVIKALNSSK